MGLEEFREVVKKELAGKMPEKPRLSALTGRVIVPKEEYVALQKAFIEGDYNRKGAGVGKGVDNRSVRNLLASHYIEVGDAKNFAELFVTEAGAGEEALEAAKRNTP